MHELSLCGAIADIASRNANGRRVETIHVRIGQLRQVVPDTLIFCWSMISTDTDLEGSVIDIERVPATLSCHACGQVTAMGDVASFACTGCGDVNVSVVTGEEFLVTSLVLQPV